MPVAWPAEPVQASQWVAERQAFPHQGCPLPEGTRLSRSVAQIKTPALKTKQYKEQGDFPDAHFAHVYI